MAKKRKFTIIITFGLLLVLTGSFFIQQTFFEQLDFAGYSWDVTANEDVLKSRGEIVACSNCHVNFEIDESKFLVLSTGASTGGFMNGLNNFINMKSEDISEVDEFIIIFNAKTTSGSTLPTETIPAIGQSRIYFKETEGDRETNIFNFKSAAEVGNTILQIETQAWKIVNNFDGTWSTFRSLGIEDVFVKEGDFNVNDWNGVSLAFETRSVTPSHTGDRFGHLATAKLQVLNIITKENEIAICKADEFLISNGSCIPTDSLFLFNEAALQESDEETIERILKRLALKENSLLEEQKQASDEQIKLLSDELAELRIILNGIELRDPEIIELIGIEITEEEITNDVADEIIDNIQEDLIKKQTLDRLRLVLIIASVIAILVLIGFLIWKQAKKK